MYFATIDCGTTNSRVYIVNKKSEILGQAEKNIGVRNTVITGSNQVLKEGLVEIFYQALKITNLKLSDIKFIISSGMITSEIGLLEIPHLWAPASIDDLASNIKKVLHDNKIFPLNIPLYFIRGIKNYFPEGSTYKDLRKIDFMRGEETQVAGLVSTHYNFSLPLTIVVLSSHTKYIHINKEKKICGSLTTLNGQIFEAIKKETSISKSIQKIDREKDFYNFFDEEIVNTAYDSVRNAGLLRTMMMPRFMEILLETKWYERNLFLNAAIATDDLFVLNEFQNVNFALNNDFIIIGHENRCKIFSYLLGKHYHISRINCIHNETEISKLSIYGAMSISQKANLI